MQQLAWSSGSESVAEFCGTIVSFLGEDILLVDSVLWRFAPMCEDYVARFIQLGSHSHANLVHRRNHAVRHSAAGLAGTPLKNCPSTRTPHA
jgi:hypothetical protein